MIIGLETGKNNENLEESRQRIIEGGSWKKQRVVSVIPAGKSIPTKVYLSHCGLVFPPNNPAYRMASIGLEVGEAFSNAFTDILNHEELSQWEYVLTVEHDNVPKYDSLMKLLAQMEQHPELSAIGGLYWTKGEAGVPQIWGDIKDPLLNFRPQPPPENGGLIECYGLGMGFTLFRLSMFKDEKLRKPWFKTLNSLENTGVGTQDLYFWTDARKYGYRCAVDCDVKIGHYDVNTDITW